MTDESGRWTDEDDAQVAVEALPDGHPSLIVDAFRLGLQMEHPGAYRILAEGFVTPESVETWGDFSRAKRWAASESKISTTAIYAKGAPDVAYVRLVMTDKWVGSSLEVPEHAVVTLIWRPEIEVVPGGWRIHSIGEALDPASLPRSADGRGPTL